MVGNNDALRCVMEQKVENRLDGHGSLDVLDLSSVDYFSQTEGYEDDSDGQSRSEDAPVFAAKETARVQRWRVLVVSSILLIGSGLSFLTYKVLHHEFHADSEDAVSNQISRASITPFLSNPLHNLLSYFQIYSSISLLLPSRTLSGSKLGRSSKHIVLFLAPLQCRLILYVRRNDRVTIALYCFFIVSHRFLSCIVDW